MRKGRRKRRRERGRKEGEDKGGKVRGRSESVKVRVREGGSVIGRKGRRERG